MQREVIKSDSNSGSLKNVDAPGQRSPPQDHQIGYMAKSARTPDSDGRPLATSLHHGNTRPMQVQLINPSDTSFGTAVITPRWLYVLAAATPACFGDPVICDETLEHWDPASVEPGDVVGIGIHTGNASR